MIERTHTPFYTNYMKTLNAKLQLFTGFLAVFLLINLKVVSQDLELKSSVSSVIIPTCTPQSAINSQFSSWKNRALDFIYGFQGTDNCTESLTWSLNGNGNTFSTQVCPSLYSNIISLFPEQKDAMSSPETSHLFVENGFNPSKLNLVLEEESEVYISFVWEGAGWTNSFGYYTYHISNPPKSVNDLEKIILFENATKLSDGGPLRRGDTKKLGDGRFPAGTVIGFFMVAQGWDRNTNQIVPGLYTHYTNIEFNPKNLQQHTLFYENFPNGCKDLVLTFEDIRISTGGDRDYNDVIFIVRTDVDKLIADITPPNACGGGVNIEWEYKSNCSPNKSGQFSFLVESLSRDDVVFNVPANHTEKFSSQAALNEAFNSWLTLASFQGGCSNGNFYTIPEIPAAPDVCGGSVEVQWIYKDNCITLTEKRTFTALNNQPVISCIEPFSVQIIDNSVLLENAQFKGGVFSGSGVNSEAGIKYYFSPVDAGLGTHTLTYSYTNDAGCIVTCSFDATVTPIENFECLDDIFVCHDQEPLTLIYSEFDGGVFSGEGVVDNVFSPSSVQPGTYPITYNLNNHLGNYACEFNIIVTALPQVTFAPLTPLCFNNSPLILTGGLPVGGIYSGTGVNDGIFDPAGLNDGKYEITYTYYNQYGCVGSASQTIEINSKPCIEIEFKNVTCNGAQDGFIKVASICNNVTDVKLYLANSEIPTKAYEKIGKAIFNGLEPGTYIVEVNYKSGCKNIETIVIAEPEPLALSLAATRNVSHFGAADGFLEVAASGGVPGYEYLWDNGTTAARIENLNPGSYSVVAFDTNNCMIAGTFDVGGPTEPEIIFIDLSVGITVNDQTPDPSKVEELTFTVTLTNRHDELTATGVSVVNTIDEPFPFIDIVDNYTNGSFNANSNIWVIGDVAPGETKTIQYRTGMLLTEAKTKSWQTGINAAQILKFEQVDPNLDNNNAEIVVTVGESSGGDDNGIESNGSMAAKLALRNHRRLVENNHIERAVRNVKMESLDITSMLTGTLKSAVVGGHYSSGIGMMIPERGPANSRAYISTPVDLLGITNAKEIFSVDYLQTNNARRAAVLAIATDASSVYEHTKVICDRLIGAELRNIEMIEIAGKPFIMSQLVHPNGYIDYSVSFIAQRKGGRMLIDNRWYNEEYQILNSDDIMNFQVWSVTPQFTRQLVENIIKNMDIMGGVEFRNEEIKPQIPQVYVHSGRYVNGGLMLNLVNKVGADKITLQGTKSLYENAPREAMKITLNIPTNEFVEVFIPTGYLFDAGFSITNNKHNAPDVLYYADGAWMFDYDPGNAVVTSFATKAETNQVEVVEYKVERDAAFSGRVRTWASMFRSLSPRNMPVDMSAYDQIVFNAKGEGVVEVMLAKAGINQWSEQYRTTITLSASDKEYRIKFSDLANKDGLRGFTANDLISVIFNPLGNGNSDSKFEVSVSNLYFTNSNYVIAPNAIFYPAYPNPFNSSTSIDVAITRDSHVRIEVLNMFGQLVEILANEEMGTGNLRLNWTPAGHKPGVYMIKVMAGESNYISKVIFQK